MTREFLEHFFPESAVLASQMNELFDGKQGKDVIIALAAWIAHLMVEHDVSREDFDKTISMMLGLGSQEAMHVVSNDDKGGRGPFN